MSLSIHHHIMRTLAARRARTRSTLAGLLGIASAQSAELQHMAGLL